MKPSIKAHGAEIDFTHLCAWAGHISKNINDIRSKEDLAAALLAQVAALQKGAPPPYEHEALMAKFATFEDDNSP